MKEAVNRILEGKFHTDVHSLNFSTPLLELVLEPGEQQEGSFTICGDPDVMTEGSVSSTELRMKCLVEHFSGAREEIPYLFDATGMAPGESLKGEFRIISNQGEYLLPFDVRIRNGELDSSLGDIRNLFHFTNLARTNWTEAVRLFFSPDFERILSGTDRQYRNSYRALGKGASKEQFLEEFLLVIKKKQKTEFIIENNEIRLDNPQGMTEKRILIQRNGWGYSELTVSKEGDFLSIEKETIREEDFLGNCHRFSFYIAADRLHDGKNYGILRFQNPYTEFQVKVIVYNHPVDRKRMEKGRQKKHAIVELMQYYEAFRTKRISAASWMKETSRIIDGLMELDEQNPAYMLMKVQLLITQERNHEAEWLLGQADERLAGHYDPTLYCYYMYLTTLLDRTEEHIDEMALQVERIFAENRRDWRIAWLLIYLSEDYARSSSKKWIVLEEQFAKGATSPVLYIEAYHLILHNPAILMGLSEFEQEVLYFAAKKELLTAEVASQIVYLAQKQKGYRKKLFRILCACYQVLPTDEVLRAVCTLLINGNITEYFAFPWYEKAIQKELRITRLYEYYMMSLELSERVEIPKMVLMYFAFDSNLDSLHNSFLYAYIHKNKAQYPELYESYREQIERFVVFQLLQKKNNKWLSYLYKNLITEGMITGEVAEGLLTVLFLHEIHWEREQISKILVVYEGVNGIQEIPVSGKCAQIPLYGSSYQLVLEDQQGNRFCREEEYEKVRLMIPDKLAGMMVPYATDEILFDLWICEKGNQLLPVSDSNVESMKRMMHSPAITETLQKEIRMKLLQFFYDKDRMEELDECLNELLPEPVFYDRMPQLIRYMVIRGMYEKAYEWLCICGGDGIEAKMIARLCNRLIALEGMQENPVLTTLIYRAFTAGKYDETLLQYLVLYFNGTVKEMRDVWNVAQSFGVDTLELGERILIQMLHTGAFIGNSTAIFKSYVEKNAGSDVEKAFLSQSAYDYFVRDKITDGFVFEEIRRLVALNEELPLICRMAYTKYFAENKKQIDDVVYHYLITFLREMTARGMVFPYYKEYAEDIAFMHKYMDRTMVEYRVKAGNKAIIHYLIEREGNVDSEYHKEEMRDMYGGVCVKDFVLFFGERLQYYIVEVENGEEQLTESGTFSRSDTDMNQSVSRYNLINDIAMARTLKDYETMEKLLYEYYDYAYLLEELFSVQ